ncbi:MAG: hypothetical protein ACREMW_06095, partial [Gemmatimonadales bacterium]
GGGGGSGGGGAGGGGGGAAAAIVGTWRHVSTLISAGETVVSDTRWSFGSDLTCSKLLIQTFVNAGFETTEVRPCTYTPASVSVRIVFDGSSVPVTFSVSFSNGNLILDGFVFTRLA